jgi:hypothetical protein
MKIGSILTEPINSIEQALTAATSKRAELQASILVAMEQAAKMDDIIKGYRHALVLLHDEANKV